VVRLAVADGHGNQGGGQRQAQVLRSGQGRNERGWLVHRHRGGVHNVDKGGDRILPGAFTKTLEKWRRSADPIPVIWSHEWTTPDAHIGVADPHDVVETENGLLVRGKLDIDDDDVARRVYKLMQRRSLKEFSFGYSVPPGGQRRAKDGANEIIEIDPLIEVGPTLKGMNPATELHAVKGIEAPDADYLAGPSLNARCVEVKERMRQEMYALLTGPSEVPAPKRQRSLLDRELRRECDRMRLEAALGWDTDLINNLRTKKAA
jgi:HK97 family phage prohead protease